MKLSRLQKWAFFLMIAFAAFFVFRMMSGGTQKSVVSKSLMNVHVLGMACRQYASDHHGNFPPSLDVLVPGYLKDRSSLASPLMPGDLDGYIYTPGLKDMGPVNAVLIEDKFAPVQHLRIVTYVDGSSRILNSP